MLITPLNLWLTLLNFLPLQGHYLKYFMCVKIFLLNILHILRDCLSDFEKFLFTSFSELIYKEVMDLEERTKNGVIRGQPSPLGWLQYKLSYDYSSLLAL